MAARRRPPIRRQPLPQGAAAYPAQPGEGAPGADLAAGRAVAQPAVSVLVQDAERVGGRAGDEASSTTAWRRDASRAGTAVELIAAGTRPCCWGPRGCTPRTEPVAAGRRR